MVTEVNPIRDMGFQWSVTTGKLIVPSRHRNKRKKTQIAMKYLKIPTIKIGIVSPPTSSDTNHLLKGQLPPQINVANIRRMYDLSSFFLSTFWVVSNEIQLFYLKFQEIFVVISSDMAVQIEYCRKNVICQSFLCL